ncbi:hypothetical protein TNCV_4670991 [Trichonephila clavipes]|nr:hypothetical protein TNCV_4670991 [Trichonephila clavipes]
MRQTRGMAKSSRNLERRGRVEEKDTNDDFPFLPDNDNFQFAVHNQLHATYPRMWIGRRGLVACSPRSLDHNPLQFF